MGKKEDRLEPLEAVLELYGDTWVWIAFAPAYKLIPAWVVGRRTLAEARQLIKCLKTSTDGHIPFFTSDDLPHYADALLDVYGEVFYPPKQPGPGRTPLPYKVPPGDWVYAVVVKHRENGRVVDVSARLVYGSPEQLAEAIGPSSIATTVSTYGVERNNLTLRQHARRITRKVNAFSKERSYLKDQLALAFAYYHFVIPHQGLRQRLQSPIRRKGQRGSPKVWSGRTPAMAAGLTDHIWSMDELLSFRVPPKNRWSN